MFLILVGLASRIPRGQWLRYPPPGIHSPGARSEQAGVVAYSVVSTFCSGRSQESRLLPCALLLQTQWRSLITWQPSIPPFVQLVSRRSAPVLSEHRCSVPNDASRAVGLCRASMRSSASRCAPICSHPTLVSSSSTRRSLPDSEGMAEADRSNARWRSIVRSECVVPSQPLGQGRLVGPAAPTQLYVA